MSNNWLFISLFPTRLTALWGQNVSALFSNVYPVLSLVPTCGDEMRGPHNSYLVNEGTDEYHLITVAL